MNGSPPRTVSHIADGRPVIEGGLHSLSQYGEGESGTRAVEDPAGEDLAPSLPFSGGLPTFSTHA